MTTLLPRIAVRAFAILTGLTVSACEIDRPPGSFPPTKRTATQGSAGLFEDGGAGSAGGNGDIDEPDFSMGDGGTTMVSPDSPLAKVQGYYWLRTDIEFTYSQMAAFGTLRVFNRVSHMALTRLAADGQVLKAFERTCHIFYQHECKAGCSSFTTTVASNAAMLYREPTLPRVYTLNGANFSTDSASLLLGWTGPADPLPKSLSDPSVWKASGDPAANGFYINIKASGLVQPVNCFYNTVERFSSAYNGALKAGSLDGVNATLTTAGSGAERLDYQGGPSCVPAKQDTPPPSSSTVRFVRVDESATFWNCPALADFKVKLPDP